MRVDPKVSQAKFDLEVAKVDKHAEGLRKRGCWIVGCKYPNVDVLFVPQQPLRITAPAPKFSHLSWVAPQIVAQTREYKFLSARQFGVRVCLDDFDQKPPSVTFCDPVTWDPLNETQVPPSAFTDESGKILKLIVSKHPTTKKPFLCIRGIREYHDHPEHTGDSWHLYRTHRGLLDILSDICDACVENVRPELLWQGFQFTHYATRCTNGIA